MLPKLRRLDRKSFTKHFGEGFFISSPFFSLRVNPLKSEEISRFGVVVAQKVTKSKPERNRIKRQIYSIIGNLLSSAQKPAAVIFFIKKEALPLSFSTLSEEVTRALQQAKLLK